MASVAILKERIKHALQLVANGPCACGTPGERTIVLRWDEGTRDVLVSIECRACESIALSTVQVEATSPETEGGKV